MSLRELLSSSFSISDKALIIIAFSDRPMKSHSIKSCAVALGWKKAKDVNFQSHLNSRQGQVIETSDGWCLTNEGFVHLENLGINPSGRILNQSANDLRLLLNQIGIVETRDFMEEAIACCEAKLNRSAVVMSWLAAVHTLQTHVFHNHLSDFNAEVRRIDKTWKNVKTLDDFGKLNEAEFLDRIAAISIVGKNVKEKLKACLNERNACGHPNSYKIGENAVRSHIETLINNVFQPFST